MSQLNLEITVSNIEYMLSEHLKLISQKKYSAEQFLKTSSCFRMLGCGNYLLTIDINNFFDNLYKSAVVYLEFMTLKDSVVFDPYYLCKSKGIPLLDAIVIHNFDLARKISAKMACTFQKNMEYEEDFHYYNCLSLLSEETLDADTLNKTMLDFETSSDGGDSNRFKVIKAISQKDGLFFNESLSVLISEWNNEIKRKRKSENIDPYENMTSSNIFIEGIALIRLAQKCGITVDDKFHYIPELILSYKKNDYPESFSIMH